MNNRLHRWGRGKRRPRDGRWSAAVLMMMLASYGCDGLLDVELPGNVPVSTLEDPRTAGLQALSAEGQFYCFYNHYSVAAEMFTDVNRIATSQLGHADMYNRRPNTADMRNCPFPPDADDDPSPFATAYSALGLTREVYQRLKDWTDEEVPSRSALLARTAVFSAYTMTLLAEGFCASVLEPAGPPLGHRAVFEAAEARFTEALEHAQAAGLPQIQNLARVGRARVRLQLGNFDGAVADAQQVPPGFVFSAEYSGAAPERYNMFYVNNWQTRKLTVAPEYRNLEVQGAPDPRVQVVDMKRKGDDNITDLWLPVKYNAIGAPIRLASWQEAQLIIAEAQLGAEAVQRINAVRQSYGLPLYQPASLSNDAILEQVVEERRREFFLEGGHRLADMIRYQGRSFIQWKEGLNPQGAAVFNQTYCLPLPEREVLSNPNVPGSPGDYWVRM